MYEMAAVVPVIVGIVQVFKGVGLPSRFASLIALICGLSVYYYLGSGSFTENIFEGLVAGLTASGLYSAVKAQF